MLLPRFKRILYFFLESLIFILGVVATCLFSYALNRSFDASPTLPFLFGLTVTIVALFYFRKKTLAFKLQFEAIRFLAQRRLARLHPRRAKIFRIGRRFVLGLPCAWALLVLLFFPQVTHLFHPRIRQPERGRTLLSFFPEGNEWRHPGAEHLIHNAVQIPWSWTILETVESPGRFTSVYVLGVTRAPWPFGGLSIWNPQAQLRLMTFEMATIGEFEERRTYKGRLPLPSDPVPSLREIHATGITLSCRETQYRWGRTFWDIECGTTSPTRPVNLGAHYFGPSDGLEDFYQLISTAKAAH